MNENKKRVLELMESYFYDCENNGISDFDVWCEDNTSNDEQVELINKLKSSIENIAFNLFEY